LPAFSAFKPNRLAKNWRWTSSDKSLIEECGVKHTAT
jgi:hypothetical protein